MILQRYAAAVKWLIAGNNLDIVLTTGERINEKLKERATREKWEKLNAEISEEAEKDLSFKQAVEEVLETIDRQFKESKIL